MSEHMPENQPIPATLKDGKGRTWVEDLETAKEPTSMPIWTLEHLTLKYHHSEGWALHDQHRKFASGRQAVLEAISSLDAEIKNGLSRADFTAVLDKTQVAPSRPPITDREGRVWTLQYGSAPFWFTHVTFEDRKREVRIVPNGGGQYALGRVGDEAFTQILQEVSVERAIDLAAREYLPREMPAQDRITDKDGRVWTWQDSGCAGADPAWVSADGWIFWKEGKAWTLRFIDAGTLCLDNDIDLHESTIWPAINAATKHLPKPVKEAPVNDPQHKTGGTAEPYTDTAGRLWRFDVRDSTWSTNVVFPGEHPYSAEIRMVRVDQRYWTLEGMPGGSINTGNSVLADAVEGAREFIDVATLTPETAAIVILDGLSKSTPQEPVKGAWIVVNEWSEIRVFVDEIDALRYVNDAAKTGEVKGNPAAFFVPDGQTVSDVRGY